MIIWFLVWTHPVLQWGALVCQGDVGVGAPFSIRLVSSGWMWVSGMKTRIGFIISILEMLEIDCKKQKSQQQNALNTMDVILPVECVKTRKDCVWWWYSLSSFVCHRSESLFSELKNI